MADAEVDLGPVLAEFARVLRPGGHLVISDMHHHGVEQGSIPKVRGAPLRGTRWPSRAPADPPSGFDEPGPWELWPWSLADLVPEAARVANADRRALVVWHFQLA